jgi:hypothetical protein
MNRNSIISLGLGAFLIVGVLIVQLMILNRLDDIEESGNSLKADIEQLESENEDLRQQLKMKSAPPSEIPESFPNINGVRVLIFLNISLVVALAFTGFVATYFQSRYLNKEKRVEAKHIQEQAYRAGFTDAPRRLVTKTDVLSNLVRWLAQYERGTAKIDDAAMLQRQLLKHLDSTANL